MHDCHFVWANCAENYVEFLLCESVAAGLFKNFEDEFVSKINPKGVLPLFGPI